MLVMNLRMDSKVEVIPNLRITGILTIHQPKGINNKVPYYSFVSKFRNFLVVFGEY